MTPRRRCFSWLLALVALAALYGAAPNRAVAALAQGPEQVGVTSATAKVSAFRGRVLFSTPVGDAAHRRYRLFERFRDRTRRLPIRSRRTPFDVDLGPDGRGGLVAVYSRCNDEIARSGCDLFRFDLQRRREARLRSVSRRTANEQLPTIWGTHIAFVRTTGASDARILTSRIGGEDERRVVGGTAPSRPGAQGRAPTSNSYGPVELELRGGTLAFMWDTVPEECQAAQLPTNETGIVSSEVWIVDGGDRRRLIAGCAQPQALAMQGASFVGRWLYFRYARRSAPDQPLRGIVRREHTVSGVVEEADAAVNAPFNQDGNVSYFTGTTASGRTPLLRDRLQFSPLGPSS